MKEQQAILGAKIKNGVLSAREKEAYKNRIFVPVSKCLNEPRTSGASESSGPPGISGSSRNCECGDGKNSGYPDYDRSSNGSETRLLIKV